jgi:hypothetical protein
MSTRLAQQQSSSRSPELDSAAISSLFPRVAAITILFLVVLISIRGAAGAKAWDQAAFAFSVTGGALLAIRFLRSRTMTPSRLALFVAIGGIGCGIAAVERPSLTTIFWEGFGTGAALLSLPLALLIVPMSAWLQRSRVLAYTLATVMMSLAVVDAVSLIRDLSDFAVPSNNIYVLNEMLAPAAGRVPGANFVPQYTTLFGWVLVPFRHLLSANELANVATLLLSALGIVGIALATILARRCLPGRSLWLAVGLTVPLATVTVFHGALSSSIGSYLQEVPIRLFPAMLYSVIAVNSLVALLHHSVRKLSLISLGLLAGMMAWNSQDIGVVVPMAYGIVLQMATRGGLRKRATALWLTGLAPGLMLYPIWTLSTGHPIQFQYLLVTVRSFGGGFGSAPIQIPGPVLLVLPVILGSVVVGVCLLWKALDGIVTRPQYEQHAIVTLAFVGLWSMGSLPYYVNRSYASGQLQIFLLPFGVCCCALLSLCYSAAPTGERRLGSELLSYLRGRAVWLLPVTLPIAVGFGAILQTPYPSVTLNALAHPPAKVGFRSALDDAYSNRGYHGPSFNYFASDDITAAQAYARNHGGGVVGYLGANANYLALLTGADPRILYDDPEDFEISQAAYQLGCDYIRHNPTRWLVAAPGMTFFVGATICGEYEPWPVPGERPDTVFKLDPGAVQLFGDHAGFRVALVKDG